MPERKQKFALVNYQAYPPQIIHVFDQDTPTIAVPDHGDVKPSKGLFIGQYQIWDVRLAQSPDQLRASPRGMPDKHEMQGQPLYHIEPAGRYVYETAVFVEKKAEHA